MADVLRVWVGGQPVGRLERNGDHGSRFVYDANVAPADAVSLVLPVRLAPYDLKFGLLPAFDMNVPEGALLSNIRSVVAQRMDRRHDAFGILALIGGNQVGRVRVLTDRTDLAAGGDVTKVASLLNRRLDRSLVAELFERHAMTSGVSGAMPKVLPDTTPKVNDYNRPTSFGEENHILKFDSPEFPGLSLNEYHCLAAARAAGNEVADATLSDDGKMLAVRRFDRIDGRQTAFEDFASLNEKRSEQKYDGSIETSLFKTLERFSGPDDVGINLEKLYRMTVTNIALRNGDAHLKNHAVMYEDAEKGPICLAPAYDIVTTGAWIRNDLMALTLGGTKRWPQEKAVLLLGARAGLSPERIRAVVDEVNSGISSYLSVLEEDLLSRGLSDLSSAMRAQWTRGLIESLGASLKWMG